MKLKILKKQYWLYYLLTLFTFIILYLVKLVDAQSGANNPGHPYTQVGGGVAQGDLLYGSANDTLSALPKSTTVTHYLSNSGTNNNPAWAKVDLSSGVTGVLALSYGGTGASPNSANQVLVSTSNQTTTWKNLNDCQGNAKALTYQTDGSFGCNTITVGGYALHVQALSYNPTKNQTVYFSNYPAAPNTNSVASGKIYITKPGVITAVNISSYASTAGSNQAWPLYLQLNGTTDYLIASVGINSNEREWTNNNLNIAVTTDDFLIIKSVQPNWGTVPRGVVFNGHIYVE